MAGGDMACIDGKAHSYEKKEVDGVYRPVCSVCGVVASYNIALTYAELLKLAQDLRKANTFLVKKIKVLTKRLSE